MLSFEDLENIRILFVQELKPIKDDILEMKAEITQLQNDMVEVKADILGMKAEITQLQNDMVEVKADISEMKADILGIKADISEMKADIKELASRVLCLEEKQANFEEQLCDIREEVKLIRLTIEKELVHDIRIIAEAHQDLNRKLNKALVIEEEKETFLIRFNHLEDDMRIVKRQISKII